MYLQLLYYRVNLEEAHPLKALHTLDSNETGPLQLSSNFTDALVNNAVFESGLTRYDCIYIYTGKFNLKNGSL